MPDSSNDDRAYELEASHDESYRAHYESSPDRFGDRSYEQIRPAYRIGHLAADNRDFFGRDFEAIEPELQRGWLDELRETHGDWKAVRRFARHAYESRRGGHAANVDRDLGFIVQEETTLPDTSERVSYADPIPTGDPDNVAGEGRGIPGRD